MERGVTDSRITDCRIENIGLGAEYGGGIRLAWGCVRNQVLGNTIHKTGRGGIFDGHSAELVIRHNRVSGSGGEGLGIEIWGGWPSTSGPSRVASAHATLPTALLVLLPATAGTRFISADPGLLVK